MTIAAGLPLMVFVITTPPSPSLKVSVNPYTSAELKVYDPVIFGFDTVPLVLKVLLVAGSVIVHTAVGLAVDAAVKFADSGTLVFTANTSALEEGVVIVAPRFWFATAELFVTKSALGA